MAIAALGTSILFIYGLIIGSFLNALIWRIKQRRSIVKGRSICPNCKHQLAILDLIPVISWLLLQGKCRYCQKTISYQYPIVESITAVLFALSFLIIRPNGLYGWIDFGIWLYILASLICLGVYDLKWMILPNIILVPAIIMSIFELIFQIVIQKAPFSVATGPIIAAVFIAIIFSALAMLAGGKLMGFGDVKLVFLMGLVLGIKKLLLALFLAFNLAAIIGLGLILIRQKTRKDHIPFGPFLTGATILAYLVGTPIISWYLRVLTEV